jgi:hypothetical protein
MFFSSYKRMLMSLTLRNELLMGAEHEKLVGLPLGSVRKERLTVAFNLFYVLYQKAVY